MTTKDLEKFFKRANKTISSYEDKLKTLNYDCFIISSIVFTSDADYYYLFSVLKDNKILEKVDIHKPQDYPKMFKELSLKYKTNVIHNYKDLTNKQLNYLDTLNDPNINKDEISNILFHKSLDFDFN